MAAGVAMAGVAQIWADISLGPPGSGGAGSRSGGGQTGYSELSNRDYLDRQEGLALDKARRIKEAMRQVSASWPGAEEKRETSTGISDGTWYSQRLSKIQHAREEERGPGFMERIGEGLDAWATKGMRQDRPWEVEEASGFRPLEGIGKLASQVGETAQGLITLPNLDRNGSEARPPQPQRAPEPGERVGRPAAEPAERPAVAEVAPEQKPAAVEPGRTESVGQRVAGRLHLGSRKGSSEPEGAGVVGRQAEPPPARTEKPVASRVEGVVRKPERTVGRASGVAEPVSAPMAEAERPPARTGAEKFELEDVVASGGSGGGGPLKGLLGGGEEGLGSRLKGAGRWVAPKSREEVALPEPSGPLAEDQALFTVRGADAEFYPFGGDASTPVPLGAGAILRVIKPGEEWSGVETEAGRGIVRTDQIRRARASEVAVGQVPQRSVEPVKSRALPGSPIPVQIRRPQPETAPRKESKPLGDGLLPPLLDEP